MIVATDLKFQQRLRKWSVYLACAVMLIAMLVLTGWLFEITFLIHSFGNLPSMNPVTAIGFITFSLSLLMLVNKQHSSSNIYSGTLFAFALFVIGTLRLLGIVFDHLPQLDVVLFFEKLTRHSVSIHYGRMSPITALCFLLLSSSLLTLYKETKSGKSPAQYLAVISGYCGLVALVGYIFTSRAFYGEFTYVLMAIQSAIVLILCALAVLFATPDKGLMKELTKPFIGGLLARWLIPLAVGVPFVLGIIRLYFELQGYVAYEAGIAIFVITVIFSLLGFLVYIARILNKRELGTLETEEELTETNYFLNTVLENIPNMIFVKDAQELRFYRFNKAGEDLLGYSRNELIGKNDYDFFPKEQADFFTKNDKEVFNGDAMLDIQEEPINTKAGERWLHTKKIPVRDESGHPLYLVGISEDITERRTKDEQLRNLNAKLEESLREIQANEKIFSSLFYQSPVMKLITDPESGIYVDVNDAFAKLIGLKREEMIGKTALELNIVVNPGTREEILQQLKQQGHLDNTEMQMRCMNGDVRWIALSTTNILIRSKECHLSAMVDITERKAVEEKLMNLSLALEQKIQERTEELAKSEKKYRTLFENSPLPMLVFNVETLRYLDVNEAACNHYGYTRQEFLSMSAMDLRPQEEKQLFIDSISEQYKGTENRGIRKHIKKDGDLIYVEVIVHPIIYEGIEARLMVCNDVTARLIAEQQLQNTLKEVSDYKYALDESSIVAITNQEGVIKYVNNNFCKISKYTTEELIGHDHRLINSGYHSKEFIRNLWDTVLKGRIWKGEVRNKAKDNSVYWLDTTVVPFLNDEGKPYQFIAIRNDITEKKNAEEEVNKLTAELRRLVEHIQTSREQERKLIAREIHDELGQRLTALKIDVSMMRKKVAGNGNKQYFTDEINSVISQIDQSIESVKRIATDLRPEILDHYGVIAAITWQAQQFENRTGIPCKFSHAPDEMDLNPEVATAIYRTVQEALTNITRHAEATSVSVLIEKDEKKLLVEIKDNGKGIKEEDLTSSKSLGLIGIRERVHLLNGHLTISRNPDKGTTVLLVIPV